MSLNGGVYLIRYNIMWYVCQCLAAGQWFFPGIPGFFFTNKIYRHNIAELLLIDIITVTLPFVLLWPYFWHSIYCFLVNWPDFNYYICIIFTIVYRIYKNKPLDSWLITFLSMSCREKLLNTNINSVLMFVSIIEVTVNSNDSVVTVQVHIMVT